MEKYSIGTKVFGDWEIVREIGEGAYGKVFEVQKTTGGVTTRSALKLIRIPHSASDYKDVLSEGMDEKSATEYFREIVDQLVKEIQMMAELKSHPNIVTYEDHQIIEHEDAVGWDILIRMELLTSLTDYQIAHPMGEAEVRQLGIDICQALEFCQKKGVIHRDIKPGNIFVSEAGQFKLGDFGVARTVEKTVSSMSRQGTESYMAPEVYQNKSYGASVDIYSLGIVLYRLMNGGRQPFFPPAPQPVGYSDRESALTRRMKGEAFPLPSDASPGFSAVILKACAYTPGKRYRTAAQMRNAIQTLDSETADEQAEEPVTGEEERRRKEEEERLRREEEECLRKEEEERRRKEEKERRSKGEEERLRREKEERRREEEEERLSQEKAQKSAKRKGYIGCLIVILAMILGIYAVGAIAKRQRLLRKSGNSGNSVATVESSTNGADTESTITNYRTLSESQYQNEESDNSGVLRYLGYSSETSIDGTTAKKDITEVWFLDALSLASEDAKDVSEARDGSVLSWVSDTILYIAADGGVKGGSDCSRLFSGYENLVAVHFSDHFDTSEVTEMGEMFSGCSALTAVDISKWDTSNVTDMGRMFLSCSALTTLDISEWDTSNVTNMEHIFSGCNALTAVDISKWDTLSVTDMSGMFSSCSALTTLDISEWNTSNVTDMSFMFYGCESLLSLNVSEWDTSNATDMEYMFSSCESLSTPDVSGWDTSNVTDMNFMFYDCASISTLNVSNWNTANVTNMRAMFSGCALIKSLDLSNWNTSGVTDMRYMFSGCSSLASLDLSGWDTSNVRDMDLMFLNCASLTSFDPDWLDTSNASTSRMYEGTIWET